MDVPDVDWQNPPLDPPPQVVQPMLWRLAVRLWRDHVPAAADARRCRVCELSWPCPARGYAERGLLAACRHPTVGRSATSFADWFLSERDHRDV